MSCICTFSLEAAFHGCPNIYGHFERSAFMEGFLSSYRFMISVVLNKTVIAYQSQADDLLSSSNLWHKVSVCDVYVTGRKMHAGTFVRLFTVTQYIGL